MVQSLRDHLGELEESRVLPGSTLAPELGLTLALAFGLWGSHDLLLLTPLWSCRCHPCELHGSSSFLSSHSCLLQMSLVGLLISRSLDEHRVARSSSSRERMGRLELSAGLSHIGLTRPEAAPGATRITSKSHCFALHLRSFFRTGSSEHRLALEPKWHEAILRARMRTRPLGSRAEQVSKELHTVLPNHALPNNT